MISGLYSSNGTRRADRIDMAHRAFVLGLSGIPGSGKTTLLDLLLRDHPRAEAVAYDRSIPA